MWSQVSIWLWTRNLLSGHWSYSLSGLWSQKAYYSLRCHETYEKLEVTPYLEDQWPLLFFSRRIFVSFFFFLLYQCCGSRSAWIRIHLVVLDPDPYWECGSGSGSRSKDINRNLQINLVSCLGFCTFVVVPCCTGRACLLTNSLRLVSASV